jgi:hypothetical protein
MNKKNFAINQILKIKNKLFTKPSVGSLEDILHTLVEYESARKTAPHKYGIYLEPYLTDDIKLKLLGKSAENLLLKYPDSVMLLYFRTVALAKHDKLSEANTLISRAIVDSRIHKDEFDTFISTKRTIALLKIWRILDQIAREKMKWADGDNIASTNYNEYEFLTLYNPFNNNEFDVQLSLFFAESALQGKNIDAYLATCKIAYKKANKISEKLKVIFAIRRQGLRRLANYHQPYNLAKDLFIELRDDFKEYISFEKKPEKTVPLLRTIMNVSRALGFQEDFDSAKKELIKISLSQNGKSVKWLSAFALVEADPIENYEISKKIINSTTDSPKSMSDIQHYLSWANLTQEYQKGYNFFSKQPMKVKRHKVALVYVKILQRLGKFQEATKISKEVHAAMLARPHQLCPFTSWSLVKRAGELSFLEQTKKIYSLVPQPKEPKGVIFITARSIDQLRKTPLVVLMEFKRMGWAVIPLTQGLLPIEKTGIKEVDLFIGCQTADRDLSKEKLQYFDKIEDFKFMPEEGSLKWQEIDMSHIIWEEAAINRRAYNVDYTCPALQSYLSSVVKWTYQSATILKNAQKYMEKIDMRAGLLIQFNSRLPDSVYRFYCETKGDPEKLFCLHSANGYQNYFSNFSTNISSKGIMRNMTRHPETRSGSFPVPKEFKKFYRENQDKAKHMYEMVQNVTKVKRSTSGETELPQDAKLALLQIEEWKKNGGKVACAFGKVVYDSAVPYDGGPAHKNMKDWLNHTIDSVKDSNTLLLIKPHPHELNQEISTFGNELFFDLIETELNKNVIYLGHKWFDIFMLKEFVDIGLIYNGTTSIELGILEIPSVLCSYFAPIDYPIGQAIPKNRTEYKKLVRFEKKIQVAPGLKYRASAWLYYMSGDYITLDYRYVSRPITNKVVYPPYWFKEDITKYLSKGDENVSKLAHRALYE